MKASEKVRQARELLEAAAEELGVDVDSIVGAAEDGRKWARAYGNILDLRTRSFAAIREVAILEVKAKEVEEGS